MKSDLRKIWAIFTPQEQRRAAWMLVLVILMAMAETLGVLSIMPFLSTITNASIIHTNRLFHALFVYFGFKSERNFIFALGITSIILVVTSSIFKTTTLHTLNRFVHFERHSISTRLLSRYLFQPYEFFLSRNSSSLAQQVLAEVDQLVFELIQPLAQLVAHGAVVLAMAILIFAYDPLTAACIVASLALLYGAIYRVVRRRLVRIGKERQAANNQRYQACNEALAGIKEVKVTHSTAAYEGQFNRASRLFSRHTAANETMSQAPLYLVEASGYSGLIVIALTLLARSHDVTHILPALGLYGFAAYRMLPAAQVMYRGFAKLKFSSAALTTISDDLSLPHDVPATSSARFKPSRSIALSGVSYAYPTAAERPIFHDLNLSIDVNTSLGIVGKSGAGKSTLMDLLLGLLEPTSGTLAVDGVEITRENVGAWQKAIGFVPQHIFIADATVAENIAFGLPMSDIDMDAVERAAKAAQIHDFVVDQLADKYLSTVGDRGIRLSGGQRQRIGIARALYHDPDVLFMDEATSALDPETEDAVNDAIRQLSGRKTIVVIAHKESSTKTCKHVFRVGD